MRKSFLTGLMILLPIAVTFFLLSFLLNLFTSPFLDLANDFIEKYNNIPILGAKEVTTFIARIVIIILFVLGIFLLGFLGRWFLFKSFLKLMNSIFLKIPLFKSIYHTAKDLFDAILTIDEKKAFKNPIMVKFPSEKSSCIGFVSGNVPPECEKAINKKLYPIFVPTAPHPISGYMLFAPESEVKIIEMNNEQAVKFTVSCGVITPDKKEDNE